MKNKSQKLLQSISKASSMAQILRISKKADKEAWKKAYKMINDVCKEK